MGGDFAVVVLFSSGCFAFFFFLHRQFCLGLVTAYLTVIKNTVFTCLYSDLFLLWLSVFYYLMHLFVLYDLCVFTFMKEITQNGASKKKRFVMYGFSFGHKS